MLTVTRFRAVACWAPDLTEDEADKARRGIVEKTYGPGASICHRGDMLDAWTGVADGLVRLGLVSRDGKGATLAGLRTGVWFGEGSLLKNEARRYDLVCLRETRMALMNRATFDWLFEHSAGFNRFLVRQFNERLGQFIALAESDRTLDATGRIARNIAWLFNPVIYPAGGMTLDISQEELGQLAGVSRQSANRALQALAAQGLVSVSHNAITVRDLEKLSRYGA